MRRHSGEIAPLPDARKKTTLPSGGSQTPQAFGGGLQDSKAGDRISWLPQYRTGQALVPRGGKQPPTSSLRSLTPPKKGECSEQNRRPYRATRPP